MRADTRRKENNMKKIATNFHEHRVLRSDLRRKLAVLELLLWLACLLVLLRSRVFRIFSKSKSDFRHPPSPLGLTNNRDI